MKKVTKQMEKWTAKLGREYTNTNLHTLEEREKWYLKNLGITRTKMNLEFLGNLPSSLRILEVGCNIGTQLLYLQKMGFKSLYGLELQNYAVELSKSRTKDINIIQGSAFDIPFRDGFFDLVYTSTLLIHIAPVDIEQVLKGIYRCTKNYIWGYEFFAENYTQLKFRGEKELLWKTNFAKLYLDTFKDLRLIKEKKFKYLPDPNDNKYQNCLDTMFLLEKGSSEEKNKKEE